MTRILPFVLLLAACGAAEPAPATQTGNDEPAAPTDTAQTGNEPAAGDCAAGGVPDDGDAQGCDFRVAGCCYSLAAHACAAAGCTEDRCTIMESYPAQVACR